MAFVVVADRVRPAKDFAAQTLIDRIAGAALRRVHLRRRVCA